MPGGPPPQPQDSGGHLGRCKYFTVALHRGELAETADERSFVSLLFVDGEGTLACGGETMPVKKGDSIFIPAGSGAVTVTGGLTTLVTRV